MKKSSTPFIVGFLALSTFAQAGESIYSLECTTQGEYPQYNAIVFVKESALDDETAVVELLVSRIASADANAELLTRTTNARAQLSFTKVRMGNRSANAIAGVELDLGRSGSLSMEAVAKFDKTGRAPGRLQASTMRLHLSSTDAVCEWNVRSPKPSMSGSN